jgi:Tfp pilus assembly major pilin PilA
MLKKLLLLLAFGVIAYSLFMIAIPYYRYYTFKSDLEETLQVNVTDTPDEIMAKILDLANQYKVPVGEEDIDLRQEKEYVVTVSWQETVDFFTIYQKTFEFYIDTSK